MINSSTPINFNKQTYEQNREIIDRIKKNRELIKRYKGKISTNPNICKNLENTFVQASKHIKWEWLKLGYIKEPQGANRLQQLKYLTS